jgi:hypothetical protein
MSDPKRLNHSSQHQRRLRRSWLTQSSTPDESALGRIATFARDHINLFLVCSDVRNHSPVIGSLHLPRHVAQIDQKAVDLSHPYKGFRSIRLRSLHRGSIRCVRRALEMTRALALAVLWPTTNAAQTSAIVMNGWLDLSAGKLSWPKLNWKTSRPVLDSE